MKLSVDTLPIHRALGLALGFALLATSALADARRGYYRQPAIHGDTIVFVAEGDLWTVGVLGGEARRLTSHPDEERHPAISPDGRTVAFTAAYEGSREVYTMPLAGGVPVRQTYEPEASIVVGWTPSGEVLYATEQYSTLPDPKLVRLDPTSGQQTLVPLAQASDGAYTSDGSVLVFVRPDFHNNNTRRYQGGTARNLWRFTSGEAEATALTDFAGEDHSPMMAGDRAFYVSERDGAQNLWSMTLDGRDRQQHSRHVGWDVRDPSLDQGRVVYQLGADLWIHDITSGADTKLDIALASDFDQLRDQWVDDPLDDLTHWDIDPSGTRLALTARGRVFVMPVGAGRRVRLARTPGARFRDAVFMPDGEDVLLLTDASGEVEFHVVPADGTGDGRAVTEDGTILRFRGVPSPDGAHIAFTDKNDDLWVVNVASGASTRINAQREGIGDVAWSPDSRYLAFVERALNSYSQIFLHDLESGARTTVTGDRTNSSDPVWSPDGQWLYFLSDRNLRSLVGGPWGPRQPEAYFDRPIEIFQVALQPGLRPPFRARDELMPPDAMKDAKSAKKKASESGTADAMETEVVTVELVPDGLTDRLYAVPAPPGNYRDLATDGEHLFWLATDSGPDPQRHVMGLTIGLDDDTGAPNEPGVVAADVRDFRLATVGGKLAVRREKGFSVLDAKVKGGMGGGGDAKKGEDGTKVDLANWRFVIDAQEDFRQLFVDAWRLERDYFYDPGMHGNDWEAVRDKYLPLVDRVTSRIELSDVVGQAVGELSALHVSVRGGDVRRAPDRVEVATLGARLVRDAGAGGYRIETIYRPDPDLPSWRSPLADPYLDIEEGDVIVSIDGVDVVETPPGALLRDKAGRQVRIAVKSGSGGAVRDHIVVPTDDGDLLRYRHWQHGRRQEVERLGLGDIGYVHLRAMGSNNLSEWYRDFYPVFNRRGLIIDVRHNRGGNIDSLILEKLLRRAWFYWQGRVGQPTWNMQYAFRGHLVVLVDENTASDGEAFAEGFRRLGLGPVIGTRTWGGEIWLSSNNRLSDGGLARAPQTGVYGPEREWLIEGHGVDPDIEVDNLPHETFNGRDRQLETAIRVLQEKIAEDPRDVPAPPPHPDKAARD